MAETPPPVTSSPTASEEDTEPFILRRRPAADLPQYPGCIILDRAEFAAVLRELQVLNDSGDCGRMVQGIVSKMEGWNR